jgi:hypothetical protein
MLLNAPPKSQSEQSNSAESPADQFTPNVLHSEESPLVERGTFQGLKPQEFASAAIDKLHSIFAPEHLEGPAKLIYRPLFLAALGIHALLLFPGKPAEKQPEKKEKPVTITQIATGKKQPVKPKTTQITPPKKTLPKVNIPNPTSPVVKEKPKAGEPEPPKDEKKPEETPKKPPEQQKAEPNPQPVPDLTKMPPGGGASDADPFKDFELIYPGATPMGVAYQANVALPGVEGFFKGQSSKGFTIQEGASTAERKVLNVSKGGVNRFIGLFPDGTSTVYLIVGSEAEIPESIDKLKQVKALPPDYDNAFKEISASRGDAGPDAFIDPSAYYDGDRYLPIVAGGMTTYDDVDFSTVASQIVARLQGQFNKISDEPGGFGGGKLYRLSGTGGEFFLNVIPSANGGAISVTFSSDPR